MGAPVYTSEFSKLYVHPSKEKAIEWLNANGLNLSNTTILVPYKDSNGKVHFLNPNKISNGISSNDNSKKKDNKGQIRILGAANNVHEKHSIFNFLNLNTAHVPRIDELENDSIELDDHGFLILYQKGEKKIDNQFKKLFNRFTDNLIKKSNEAKVNQTIAIEPTEFTQQLSQIALKSDIKKGMCYFFHTDETRQQEVYRQIFKETSSEIEKKYLNVEDSKSVKVTNNLSYNRHILSFLKDWAKWTLFAVMTAIVSGTIFGGFVVSAIGATLGTIIAAVIAVTIFISLSGYAFYKAHKINPTTIEFGTAEFEFVSSNISLLNKIEHCISSFFKKLLKNENSLEDQNNNQSVNALPFHMRVTLSAEKIDVADAGLDDKEGSTRQVKTNEHTPTIVQLIRQAHNSFFKVEKQINDEQVVRVNSLPELVSIECKV